MEINAEKSQDNTRSRRSRLQEELQTQGYTIQRSAIPAPLIARLREAAQHSTDLARSGGWPFVRTLPKQFPPWPSSAADGIWGVQHLLHPRMPGRDVFAELYFSDEVIGPVKDLFSSPTPHSPPKEEGEEEDEVEDQLVLELFNLLVTPTTDFELRWHRDSVPFTESLDEEAALLGLTPTSNASSTSDADRKRRQAHHAQYNIALHADSSLLLVPGSHARPRTLEEQQILKEDAYAAQLPGMVAVSLQAGDVALYDNNVLHRGVYRADVARLTLHGSVGDARGGDARARNVLQHGVGEWIGQAAFDGVREERIRERARRMRERLVLLGARGGDEARRGVFETE